MRVFVVGNFTEDLVFSVPRLPEPGETLIAETHHSELGGKGLNQAVVAKRCGADVRLVAAVGRDVVADGVRALVAAEGLEAGLLDAAERSDQSAIAVAASGENTIISSAQTADALTAAQISEAMSTKRAGDILLIQGNLSRPATFAAVREAHASGLDVVANPSPLRWQWAELLPYVGTVILNLPELRQLSGRRRVKAGVTALLEAGCDRVMVTLGAHGAVLATAHEAAHYRAVPATVVDTAGAGDTVCGVFVARLAAGDGAADAATHALVAAAIAVSRRGTLRAFPNVEEIDRIMIAGDG